MAQLDLIQPELAELIDADKIKNIFIYVDKGSSITIRAITIDDDSVLLFTTKGMVKIFRTLNAAFNNMRKLVHVRPLKIEIQYDPDAMLPVA